MRLFVEAHRRPIFVVALVVGLGGVAVLGVRVGSALRVSGHHTQGAAGPAATSTSPERPFKPVASPTADFAPLIERPHSVPPARLAAGNASAAAAALPLTGNPGVYAIAYAGALFAYDTRSQSEPAWAAVLTAGLDLTLDVHADNVADLADRTPPAAVWATMTGSSQRATYTAASASVPTLWTQNAAAYPVGAFAVTVAGTQHVKWNDGDSTAPQAVTLLLLCPPFNNSCVVNRIASQVLR
jgi:hypothetical protein